MASEQLVGRLAVPRGRGAANGNQNMFLFSLRFREAEAANGFANGGQD